MQTKKFRIKGHTAYAFNQYFESKNPRTDQQLTEHANGQISRENGVLCVPGHQIKGAIKNAIRLLDIKLGKSKAKGLDFISSVVFIEPKMIPMTVKGKQLSDKAIGYIDQMTQVGMANKPMIKKTRHAIVENWEIEFEVKIFADVMDMKYIEDCLAGAQLVCNLGGLRTRGYGKFEIA
jgi:hypothetical protein